MRIDVYETEGEALDAAAELVERLLADAGDAPAVALPGGRGGRPIMLALASRGRIPWTRARFAVVNERRVPSEEAPTNRRLLREHLLAPRGVPAIDVDERDPAQGWEEEVHRVAGAAVAFDLLVLELGEGGEIGAFDGSQAAGAAEPPAIVQTADAVGLGPAALAMARRVIVVATGAERSDAVAAALRQGAGGALAAHWVLPSERVAWVVDRAAAGALLRDAAPAAPA
jgi:6-phosphogluconolactonase